MLNISKPALLFEREKLVKVNNALPDNSISARPYKVAFVFAYPDQQLPQALKEMTEKLVAACKFNLDEVMYVNQNFANNFLLSQSNAQYNISFVLAFGNVSLSHNLTKLVRHRLYKFGQLQIIQTDSLETLDKNGAAKKELWVALADALNLKSK